MTTVATVRFNQVKKLIMKLVHSHIKNYGGDFAELYQESYLLFHYALDTYDSEEGRSFSSYVAFIVWKQLVDKARTRLRKKDRVVFNNEVTDGACTPDSHFLFEFLDELSEDAKLVCSMIVETPPFVADEAKKTRTTVGGYRTAIKQYLRGANWTNRRISEAFSEIGAKL